jgi:hypothetical protein
MGKTKFVEIDLQHSKMQPASMLEKEMRRQENLAHIQIGASDGPQLQLVRKKSSYADHMDDKRSKSTTHKQNAVLPQVIDHLEFKFPHKNRDRLSPGQLLIKHQERM